MSREFLSPTFRQSRDRRVGLDPYAEHAEFPERWRAYLMAHYGYDPARVAADFQVSPRAARKWLEGETGCKGGALIIALRRHPETAPQMLGSVA
ncbi:MAG: hypothetical protein KDK24_20270 [Pseudooceanicola sp.]|nr:hypothetical protein [Pseudooceanicola sp.]